LNIDYKNAKVVERKTLELDPNKLRPGEVLIVKIAQWFGLKIAFFAVMNIDGKRLLVEQLRVEQKNFKP
jgi:hypothetical protein